MNDNLTSVTLDLAADAIQMAGWQTGNAGMDPDGPYCLMGGIGAATDAKLSDAGRFSYWAVEETLAAGAVRDYLGIDKANRLWRWNDSATGERVIEVLRAAAAVERVKEATAAYENADQPLPVEIPEPTAA